MTDVNLAMIIIDQLGIDELKEREFHIHKDGHTGGSDLYSCAYSKSRKLAGLKAPKKTGLKAEVGAMSVGKLDHKLAQEMVKEHFRSKYQGDLRLGIEIYEPYDYLPGWVVESPIDVATLTEPGVVIKALSFRNVDEPVEFRHKDAKYDKIWDIKTINSMGFWSRRSKPISKVYKGQMHGYMFQTTFGGGSLKEIVITFINKETFQMYDIVVPWDQVFWDEMLERNRRIQKAAKIWQDGKTPEFASEDLFALDEDLAFRCSFCAYSECREIIPEKQKPRLELIRPCKVASKLIIDKAYEKFTKGSRWKRGRSIIDIVEINGTEIISINTTNRKLRDKGEEYKTYIDSIFAAYNKFTELDY